MPDAQVNDMKTAAVIAAAGLSSRMHEFKPLLTLDGSTVIGTLIAALKEAGIEEIIVTTGYKSDILTPYLESIGVKSCYNPAYAESTMYDSVCIGIKALEQPYDKLFIMPGDVPLVEASTIKKMMKTAGDIVRPVCMGTTGHPVMFSRGSVPLILSHSGENGLEGAINAIIGSGKKLKDIEVDDNGTLLDADTKEDFQVLRKEVMQRKGEKGFWANVEISIGKGDIVFSPESVQFLEMIDHCGSIQSACSCMHMSYSKGWKMLNSMEANLGFRLVERQNGGAGGGGTTLTEEGKKYVEAYQLYRHNVLKYAEESFDYYFRRGK